MSKISLSVEFDENYKGVPQIEREMHADCNNSIEGYALALLQEVPKNETELNALVALYSRMHDPTQPLELTTEDEGVTIDDCVRDIVAKGDDVTVVAENFSCVGQGYGADETMKNLDEYRNFQYEVHHDNTQRYGQWQLERMRRESGYVAEGDQC